MKLKSSLLLAILCASISTFGQNHKVDSLLNLFKKATHDTTRIRLYINIGEAYDDVDPDKAMLFFGKAISSAEYALSHRKTNHDQTIQIITKLRLTALVYTGIQLRQLGKLDEALLCFNKTAKQCGEKENKAEKAECYSNIGSIYKLQGDYEKSTELLLQALKLSEEIGDKSLIANCCIGLGNTQSKLGNYDKANQFYLRSLKILEELGDKKAIAICYFNIGLVYKNQKNNNKAIEYYTYSLKILESQGNKALVSTCYNNIGNVYYSIDDYDKALDNYLKSMKIAEELKLKQNLSNGYNNIGIIYSIKLQYAKAIEYYEKALKIREELGVKNDIANVYSNIAGMYYKMAVLKSKKNSKEQNDRLLTSIRYGQKAIALAQEIGAVPMENSSANVLLLAYKAAGDYKKATEYAEIYIATNDSMFSAKKTEALAEMEAKYQNDKKQKEIEILEKDKIISNEKAQKQKILIISILSGSGLLVFLITFILRRLQITRRQKRIIEEKNILLNEKNEEISAQSEEIASQRDNLEVMNTEITLQRDKIAAQHNEITASINYASRIQKAMLPSQEIIAKNFPEYFVLYRPCQIVSGDFYWFKQVKNILYVVAADCTGHGIPGAFMSMLGLSLLNETISPRDVNPPHETLNELRKRLKKTLHQTGEKGEQQDGMDIALCMIDLETKTVQFSGAYNPFFLIRNNELTIVKGDRMPIGVYPRDNESFTVKEIQLQPNDTFYIFSDGYVAQNGDEKNEKFKLSRFKDALLSIQNKSMLEQKEILENTFDRWKGNQDQVDDILVVGVRV